MAPIVEDDAVVRGRLVKVLEERRKSFRAGRKRYDDFVARLNKGNYAKYRREKVNVPSRQDRSDPEFAAFRAVTSAVDEWKRVLIEEERYYLTIIEDGRLETWQLVSNFVEYSVLRARQLGYAYQAMYKEVERLQRTRTSHALPLVKELAGDELAADNGIIDAARHRQNTIYLVLEALKQGPPADHLARFNAWVSASGQMAAARDRQRRQNDEDFAYILGAFLSTVTAAAFAGGGNFSPMPTNAVECKDRDGDWFENEGLPFCVGYR